jgi:hypothetical protein
MFQDIVNKQSAIEPILPISHITSLYSGGLILECGFLSSKKSKDESKSICFFYGVPLYKPNSHQSQTSGMAFDRPIGMVFKSDLIALANKVYPFDSGAFDIYFKKYFPPDVNSNYFEISPVSIETPGKLVSLFYGSNDNYIYGRPISNNSLKSDTITDAIIMEALFTLFESKDIQQYDERNHGIELQYFSDITLKDNLELVVFPRHVYEESSESFKSSFKNVAIEFYEESYRYEPKQDCILVQAKVKEYFRKNYGRKKL